MHGSHESENLRELNAPLEEMLLTRQSCRQSCGMGITETASAMHVQLPKCCALKLHTSVRPIFLERDPFIDCLRPDRSLERL